MFVTFYSYKGGVGRTSALMNTAYYLAQTGRDICLVDFDLEAPGLYEMPCFKDKKGNYLKSKKGGIVDYINSYLEDAKIPDINDYLININIKVTNKNISKEKSTSKIYFLPAGKLDEDYTNKLEKIDWNNLYSQYFGYNLIEKLKKDLKEKVKGQTFDYIFIDSRTGFNDNSGICTLQIPDLVVLLFNLNFQNIEGIKKVYNIIKQNYPKYQKEKFVKILPVLTMIPDAINENLGKKIKDMQSFFSNEIEDSKLITISYNSLFSNKETIIFKDDYADMIYLSHQYKKLANKISINNHFDIITLRNNLEKELSNIFLDENDVEDLLKKSEKIIEISNYSIDFYNHSFLLYRKDNYLESLKYIDKALDKAKNYFRYLYHKTHILIKINDLDKAKKLINLMYDENKDSTKNLSKLVITLAHIDNYDLLEKVLQKLIRLECEVIENQAILAQTYFKNKKYDLSLKEFKLLLEKNDKNIENYIYIANVLSEINNYHEALNYIELGIKIDKDNIELYNEKVKLLLILSREEEALNLVSSKFKKVSDSKYIIELCENLIDFCLYNNALEFINTYLKIDSKNIKLYKILIEINILLDKYDSIKDEILNIEKILNSSYFKISNKFEYYCHLINFFNETNYKEKAIFYYNCSELLYSSNKEKFNINMLNKLALYSLSLGYLEKAQVYYEEILSKENNNLPALFNVSILCLKLNKKDNIKNYFKKFLESYSKEKDRKNLCEDINHLSCKAIALSYLGSHNKKEVISILNLCIEKIISNNNITKIFSPIEYRLIKKEKFISMCNLMIENLNFNKEIWSFYKELNV